MRSFRCLTNAFPKRVGNLTTTITLHLPWYKFVSTYKTLGMTLVVAPNVPRC